MPELRWILLVLGALLVAGLWWWELKRSRATGAPPLAEPEPVRPAERHEPRFGEHDALDAEDDVDVPSIRADERPIPRGDPPVLTIDDLPEDTDRVVLAPDAPEPRRLEPMSARRDVPGSVVPEAITIASSEPPGSFSTPPMHATRSEAPISSARPPAARAAAPAFDASSTGDVPAAGAPAALGDVGPASFVRAQPAADAEHAAERPVERAAERPAAPSRVGAADVTATPAAPTKPAGDTGSPESRRPAARPAPGRTASPVERLNEPRPAPSEPPSPLQKIVALRLVSASGDRIDGGQLRAALEAEGMRFGKYSIFHRQRADGKAIYSAASLLEPGSFDLDRMDAERYPGISMFAVFPGPIEAPETFEELLATARRLADRLDVVAQDERGAPLGAQRALAIREELVHFQGLVNKTRSRSGG
jgi:FtsZ-interacting cell division protein ZipA